MMPARGLLIVLLWASLAQAFTIKLAWQPPATPPSVQGYRAHWGTSAGSYVETTEVGTATTAMLGGFAYDTTYYLAITAFNTVGESPYSNEVTVMVPAPILDTELPIVLITEPENGAQVKPTKNGVPPVTIAATATDNLGVTQFSITVNGNVLCTRTMPPWSCPWTVPPPRKKTYVLEAFAIDAGGNVGTSPPVTVKVP